MSEGWDKVKEYRVKEKRLENRLIELSPIKSKSGNTAYEHNHNRIGFPFAQYK